MYKIKIKIKGGRLPDGLEGVPVRDVVHERDAVRALEVADGDSPEPFLPRGVPYLKLDVRAVDAHVLYLEVDPDRRYERRREAVVRVAEEEAGLADPRVAKHKELYVHVIFTIANYSASGRHRKKKNLRKTHDARAKGPTSDKYDIIAEVAKGRSLSKYLCAPLCAW